MGGGSGGHARFLNTFAAFPDPKVSVPAAPPSPSAGDPQRTPRRHTTDLRGPDSAELWCGADQGRGAGSVWCPSPGHTRGDH